ncbi:GTPase IMAP family member 9-like [Engraulis encrasicolus]|uniref:GTPase IMAP family member 9-like n=1 Tax=Engraulis encrasicolus TaxID=184585 RepID=UPI002FD733A9
MKTQLERETQLEEMKRQVEESARRLKKMKRLLERGAEQRDGFFLSELGIVLLGCRYVGKSSSGNTILGREEFGTAVRTAQCVERQGEVAGRHVTVVEAPGWNTWTTEETPSMTEEEIELRLPLCPPGPQALLLVISVNRSFTEIYRRSVQEHLELLGERVWSDTMVLFTHGDWLGDRSIEQHIESEGVCLQWLVEKCGNRYHVLNNKRGDHMQVTQLMEKIEEMVVAANRGWCYWIRPEEPRPVRKARSMDWVPPYMSGDSDHWSFTSSAYSSFRSRASFDISSLQGTMRSTTSSQSSGIGSLGSRAGSSRGPDSIGFKVPNLLKLRKALESQERSESEEHEADGNKKSTKKKEEEDDNVL